MRLAIFILGLLLGIALTVTIYSTLPFHWDGAGYWKRVDKNKGKIILVIGHDPKCRHIRESFGSICGYHGYDDEEDRKWDEFFVVSFKDKEEAFRLRDELMKIIQEGKNANRSNNGQ